MHVASQPSGCGAVGDKKRKAEGGGRSTINQLPRLPDQRLEKLRQSNPCWLGALGSVLRAVLGS